jgi:hypothetical protein
MGLGGAVQRICAEGLEGRRNKSHTIKTDRSPHSTSDTNENPVGRETGGFIVVASAFWHAPSSLPVTLSDRSAPTAREIRSADEGTYGSNCELAVASTGSSHETNDTLGLRPSLCLGPERLRWKGR